MMAHFSDRSAGMNEAQIEERFVRFLRAFYRDRFEPQPNTIETSFDNLGENGIVADGILRFRKNDGTLFTCTFEASSREKAEEVKFTLNRLYFLWDCAAFGMVCATLALLIAYIVRLNWLVQLHGAGIFGFLLGVGMMGFLSWYFLLRDWKKYRYIYAVQQFKQYAADEQWIAIAHDVFPSPLDPYLQELKNQCIYSGFGLAIVSPDAETRVLAAPTRLKLYGEDRRIIHWITRAQWYQQMTGNTGDKIEIPVPNAWKAMINLIRRSFKYYIMDPVQPAIQRILGRPMAQTATVYTRFMKGQRVQKFVFLFALSICAYLTYQVLNIKAENIADLDAYKIWKEKPNPEDQPGYVIDEGAIPYDGKAPGVPKQYPQQEEEVVATDLTDYSDRPRAPKLSPAKIPHPGRSDHPKPNPKPKIDGCAAIKGKAGWMIQDNVFSNRDLTEKRLKVLKIAGIPCAYAAQSCLQSSADGYFIWLGDIFTDAEQARKKIKELEKTMRKAGLLRGRLLLRKI